VIVDSSALIAVIQGEPPAAAVLDALQTADRPAIAAGTLVEASVVADGPRDPVRSSRFDDFIDALDLEVVPLTAAQAAIAGRPTGTSVAVRATRHD
jgi:ribonuclease VapC